MGFKRYVYGGKPETVHRYWPVSEIYRTTGQTGTACSTVLTLLGPVASQSQKIMTVYIYIYIYIYIYEPIPECDI